MGQGREPGASAPKGSRGPRGLRLWWVDVFATRAPVSGNRLMVFVPASEVIEDEGRMQRIAREVGFSEVAFLVPARSRGEYRARFFTPERELPYAGHPTLGSAAVWSQETLPMADRNRVVQHTSGVQVDVTVLRDGDDTIVEVVAPDVARDRDAEADLDAKQLSQALGVPESALAGGEGGPALRVRTPVAQAFVRVSHPVLEEMRPDPAALRRIGEEHGVNLIYAYALPETSDQPILARGFVCDLGFVEDPATGSAAGSLGHLLVERGWLEEGRTCTVLQGAPTGRESELWITRSGDAVRVAGRVRFVLRGLMLPEFLA